MLTGLLGLLTTIGVSGLGADAPNRLTEAEREAGWELLFDGESTSGWMTPKGAPVPLSHVQEGSLNPHPTDYMLVHERIRDDFVLSLEFKISPGTNSGVFIRTLPLEPRPGHDVGFNGIEIAIDDTTSAGVVDTGAIYDLSPPLRNAMRPAGEWNHALITCDRHLITVEINGELVNRVDLDEWTESGRRPDGTAHKFDVAYKHHPRRGYIGLQDHGSDCWFRSIKLRPLAARSRRAPAIRASSSQPELPILAWHSIPEAELTIERFRELAACGINRSLMHYSPQGNAKALELAATVGVRLFVGDARFHRRGEALREAVEEYRDHPALAGYLLRDEPSLKAFGELTAVRDELEIADPSRWSYVNLLPTYASPEQLGAQSYRGHLRRFLLEFRPAVLSFDHYGILEGDRLRPDYFLNLELVRSAALEHDVPFWAFALAVPHRPYPMPTAGHLRFQAWCDFAYGAKGLQYFTYWTPAPGTWDFHDGPIRRDGARSPTWDLLASLNRDLQACAEVLVPSRVVGVHHTEPLPEGARGLDESSPLRSITGGEALVGLHVLPDGRRYALLVNRSFTTAVTLDLELADWVESVACDHPVSGARRVDGDARTPRIELEAGAGLLLRIDAR